MNNIKKYFSYFMEKKILGVSLFAFYFMIFVIIFNFFCKTIGLESLSVNVVNIKKIFCFEVLSYTIYTYLGSLLMLMFMNNKDRYKEIAVLCVPLTLVTFIVHQLGNEVVGTIFLTIFYFSYMYFKENKFKTIIKTMVYMGILAVIQLIFYLLKYQILGLNFDNIDSSTVRLLLGLDYYIFLSVIIVIKNKLKKR